MSNGYKSQIAWRRNKVHECLIKGLNQHDIAELLQISKSTVSTDVQYLKQIARENIKTHLQDRLVDTFESCFDGVNEVLKNTWIIISKEQDSKTKLTALATANECYRIKMDLVTNGAVIDDALKFVSANKDKVIKDNNIIVDQLTPNESIENTAVF